MINGIGFAPGLGGIYVSTLRKDGSLDPQHKRLLRESEILGIIESYLIKEMGEGAACRVSFKSIIDPGFSISIVKKKREGGEK